MTEFAGETKNVASAAPVAPRRIITLQDMRNIAFVAAGLSRRYVRIWVVAHCLGVPD